MCQPSIEQFPILLHKPQVAIHQSEWNYVFTWIDFKIIFKQINKSPWCNYIYKNESIKKN